MADTTPSLIEGIDYHIENHRWVFTAAYLLKRGACCGSGCRHCPYKTDLQDERSPIMHTENHLPDAQ